MLKRDRQTLLGDLNDQRLEIAWDPFMAAAFGMCVFMCMLLLLGPFVVPLLSSDKDVRLFLWVLIPIPFTVAAGFWYRHQNVQRKIAFSKDGFEFINRNVQTFSCRWNEIQGMKKFRQTLTIAKADGESVKVVIPQVKSCRNKSWFDAIIETYLPPNDANTRAKMMAKRSLVFSLACLILALGLGRPRMMKPDQDIPFALMDYIHLGAWAIAITGVFIGSLGLFGFLESSGKAKSKAAKPEPQNAFEVRVEKNFGWLETIELEPGRKYRYVEPNELKKALRSQRMGLLGFVTFLMIMMSSFSVWVLSDPRSRSPGLTLITISSLLILALAMMLAPSYLRFAAGAFLVDDELSLEGELLLVKNAFGIKKFDWKTRQSVGEVTKIQGTPAPFSKIEWIGAKPNRYMLDRRYLVECE